MIYKIAEILSLVLTFVTLQMCVLVVFTWWSEAKTFTSGNREAWAWAGFAIMLHFAGSFFDNLYWGIAWSHFFIDSQYTIEWFKHGVFSNIPFRQMATAGAGFCYIRAGYLFQKKHMTNVIISMWLSLIIGVIYTGFLWSIK
ncbi:MAG: hypothetical protein ACSHWN_04810 [Methylophilaceae bacterium]